MAAEILRIFVCSDLHAHDASVLKSGESAPSWFDVQNHGNPTKCPLTQLQELIKDNSMRADVAICAGDLGDKAHPTATRIAWKAFNEIASALEATHIVATAGNHDLDSRFSHNQHDAKGLLQTLNPKFPINSIHEFDQYWSRHFAILTAGDFRIVTLNSAAYHGYQDEYQHGRISENTLRGLKEALRVDEGKKLVNLLVCHHPPHQQAEKGQGDLDHMKLGDDLLAFLDSESSDQWLVIHGHKHYPSLQYARGSGDSPVLLSCGSISAIPYSIYGKDGRNQVHWIEFDLESVRKEGLVGLIQTLEWTSSTGWVTSRSDGGLAASSGFGNRDTINRNASLIAEVVQGKVTWKDVVQLRPMLKYLPNPSLQRVLTEVNQKHGIKIGYTELGEPDELIRPQ